MDSNRCQRSAEIAGCHYCSLGGISTFFFEIVGEEIAGGEITAKSLLLNAEKEITAEGSALTVKRYAQAADKEITAHIEEERSLLCFFEGDHCSALFYLHLLSAGKERKEGVN